MVKRKSIFEEDASRKYCSTLSLGLRLPVDDVTRQFATMSMDYGRANLLFSVPAPQFLSKTPPEFAARSGNPSRIHSLRTTARFYSIPQTAFRYAQRRTQVCVLSTRSPAKPFSPSAARSKYSRADRIGRLQNHASMKESRKHQWSDRTCFNR